MRTRQILGNNAATDDPKPLFEPDGPFGPGPLAPTPGVMRAATMESRAMEVRGDGGARRNEAGRARTWGFSRERHTGRAPLQPGPVVTSLLRTSRLINADGRVP
ncbi:MAG TPA: hypothetical protein VFA45_20850 [Actinomycetes bacterium]|nr:hypothetical protein [Actinomycetes bacterium]